MGSPLIGITTYVEPAQWGAWELPSALIPYMYVQAIERAGGRALLVPPSTAAIEETLDALDGLLLSGGSDLDPETYDQDAHPETTGTRPERDRGELALLGAALERDMPVLAVCRGSQVLNVARGGDLVQHLPEVVGDERHKHKPGVFADHDVKVEAESTIGVNNGLSRVEGRWAAWRSRAGQVAPSPGLRSHRRRAARGRVGR